MRAAIVAASPNVLASGNIKFTPDPLRRQLDACVKLSLGSYDHVALEITGNALELDSDDLVFEKATGERTAALLGNVSGTPLCLVEIAGTLGRDLSAQGQAAMVKDFGSEAQAVNGSTQAAFSNYRVRFIKPDIAAVSVDYGITVDAAAANATPEHK